MADKLKLIECIPGPAETTVGGQQYIFGRDAYGRFTCDVYNLTHRSLLLSVVHYREVERELPPDDLTALDFADESEHAGDGEDEDEDEDLGKGDASQNEEALGLANGEEPKQEPEPASEPETKSEPEAEAKSEPAEEAEKPAAKSTRKAK